MNVKERCAAVIVAAGSGKRMGTKISKQYLEINGKPILAHTLEVFEQADRITDIYLVVGAEQTAYVSEQIVEKYGYGKVRAVLAGGAERYDSVYRGILAAEGAEYLFIHDGVRPFVTEEIIEEGYRTAGMYGCAICGVPSKDTVKITDENGCVVQTPLRSNVWNVQTPQIFRYDLIRRAYDRIQSEDRTGVTDDAMVLERMGEVPVRMYRGSYMNIKITTPEDLAVAAEFIKEREKN